MHRSVVGIRRLFTKELSCQREIRVGDNLVQITPIKETYCYLTFPVVAKMNSCLENGTLEKWFSNLKPWEDFNLANGTLSWVCSKGVFILLWHNKFSVFAMMDFGCLLGISPTTEEKLNLNEAWLKITSISVGSISPKLEVQLPSSLDILRPEVFSVKDVLFRSVPGMVAPLEVMSMESCVGRLVEHLPTVHHTSFNGTPNPPCEELIQLSLQLWESTCKGELDSKHSTNSFGIRAGGV